MNQRSLEKAGQKDTDVIIANILRVGVLISSLFCAVGGILLLAQDWGKPFHTDNFNEQLKTIPGIVQLALQGHPEGVIQFGVLILISTPVLRVAFAAFAFAKEKDYIYVAIALTVLAGLIYSLTFS